MDIWTICFFCLAYNDIKVFKYFSKYTSTSISEVTYIEVELLNHWVNMVTFAKSNLYFFSFLLKNTIFVLLAGNKHFYWHFQNVPS